MIGWMLGKADSPQSTVHTQSKEPGSAKPSHSLLLGFDSLQGVVISKASSAQTKMAQIPEGLVYIWVS